MTKNNTPHSGHYFGDQRDFWWNYDFLALMAKRWNLKQQRSILDVGCGVGHWGLTLAPFLADDAELQGIDPEPQWVKKAQEKADANGSGSRFQYQLGRAEKIPFADNTFDMVTCQTVLIHVADINIALKEMLRVLKPGGLLAVAEPNNIAPFLVSNNLSIDHTIEENLTEIEDTLAGIRFQMKCELGKKNLGLGYISAGDLIPHYFHEQHLKDIQIYLSDKTSPLIPPYATKEQKVLVEHALSSDLEEIIIWPKNETQRYYLAGGGTAAEFEIHWAKMLKDKKAHQDNIKNKKLCSTGTCVMYMVSGRKEI